MMYAIISEKDGQTSLAYFKGKKIARSNYVPVSRLQQLVKALNTSDVVHVISTDRFPSAGVFVAFTDAVLKAGASMKIMEQPYLDIGNGKHDLGDPGFQLRLEKHLNVLARLENTNINRLVSTLKLNPAGYQYVCRCITDITAGILAKTYASDGIMHRGN